MTTKDYQQPEDGEVLDGVLERITYSNDENGYTVARLKVPRQKHPVTIAGHLPAVNIGEGLRLTGRWVNHPNYGRQFMVSQYKSAMPSTAAALKKYLGSGLLKGVGPMMAEHIVNTFGTEAIDVLDKHPERLLEVPGMGKRKAEAISNAWTEQRSLKGIMLFLQDQGLPITLAARIMKKYGAAAEAVVRNQPYRLAAEVYGVSFATADSIAFRLGVKRDSPQRITAGVTNVLREAATSGHVFMDAAELVWAGAELLELSREAVEAHLDEIGANGQIAVDGIRSDSAGDDAVRKLVYLPEMHTAETSVAESIKQLMTCKKNRLGTTTGAAWEKLWANVEAGERVQLTERQREAVRTALNERVAVITGGPGTGKTTAMRSIVRAVRAKKGSVALAAPTGRAARRLSEATGVPALTIHRLLEIRPGGSYEPRAPLDADLVVVDEASMMDLQLADALLRAVPPGSHLLLVGDADQLPPVGPGTVFRDVIASGAVPVVTLDTIFRQPEGSAIVENAHLINAGRPPVTGKHITDFFLFNQPSPAACADLVVDLVTHRIPQRFTLDPWDDIQVMAPMYKGICGVEALNARLQAALNPPDPAKDERRFGERIFRVGDKVMQVVNDYDKQVANGDMGRIVRIDLEEQTVEVRFDGEWVAAYSFQELDELTHGYAVSVHKAQGSEYPAVVIPVLSQHRRMLQRNLLYTAVSRARQLVVMAGSRDALAEGVANNASSRRNSALVTRLRT